MKIKPTQAIEAYKKNCKQELSDGKAKRKLQLTPVEVEHVKSVVGFILEFEKHDYRDWIRETGDPEAHVYYHAWKLNQILN